MERFRVEKYVDLVSKYKIRSLVLMPTMIHDIVNYEGEVDFSYVKTITSIGQELAPLLRKRFEEKFKIPILQNYGSTEAGHVAGWAIGDVKKGLWKPGSTGKIYPGVEVEIRDENDRKLPSGEVGEVCVKSKVTVDGYAGKKEESEALIKDGWIYMGDIGYLDNENVLFLMGRKREMIKCGGFQVWPMEIEEVLIKHPKIKDVAVIGVADERLGEIPKAFIVLRQKSDAREKERLEKEIVEFCREKMAHFKAIRQVEFIDELPRGDTGKVLKDNLRKK
jgi:long-chain acyl-CoA synthetase